MRSLRTIALATLVSLGLLGGATSARALPGFYVGKKDKVGTAHATHVAIMPGADLTVVTVMPDYEGDLAPFAFVMPVPADVTPERVQTLKREHVDRLEMLSAPRFMEFWEMDPCDPGPLEQEWERSKLASSGTDFLGGGQKIGGEKKVPKELLLTVEPDFKQGEYTVSILDKAAAGDLKGWLAGKGYALSDAAASAVKPYVDGGMSLLVAEVDPKRVELVGGERSQLSPLRYWSETKITKIPAKLGLLNVDKKQELFLYVLSPEMKRYEVKNYGNAFPPTNIEVDFAVKERMGEYYAALHDRMLAKDPKSFLTEFVWKTEGCGHPCQNEPLLVNELLSLGGDVLETKVPEEERNPEPPELTEEEKKAFDEELKALKPNERPKAKKEAEAERKEIARRKALVARQKFVFTRLHHRYDSSNLPEDPVIGPAPNGLEGGDKIPKGQKQEISTEVTPSGKTEMQVRYNNFHPWKGMMKCDAPERWRWGKPPREYRGLRKTWVANDLTRKSRTQIDPLKVTITPIAALDIPGVAALGDAGADAGDAVPEKKKGACGCQAPGAPGSAPLGWLALGAALVLVREGAKRPKSEAMKRGGGTEPRSTTGRRGS